ncbi:MAG: amino acid permease, partial [Alphaproteobacteria bacterium]
MTAADKTDIIRNAPRRNQFGAFGGVFTPSILTILGVIMFMRANFVIGQAGILGAIVILLIAKSITLMTSLSISAVSTNMQVRGGGAYYLISRVLGPEFGGAIGIALFFASALSVPFYILGFTEALTTSIPVLQPHFQLIAFATAGALFLVSYIGAGVAIKMQYFIMACLALSIVAFMGGAALLFDSDTFSANWSEGYTLLRLGDAASMRYTLMIVFAIYFPAVTGINAGINMSGDLREPSKSIPRGTLWAVGAGFIIYLLQILVCGGAFARDQLINNPYQILVENALFGMGFLVMAGVFAATLSSALGSFLGAPRVLQAVSRDPVLLFLRPFARGTAKGDEPRRALYFVAIITALVFIMSGNESEGAALNIVAAIVTMFFMFSYGMINLAAFVEAFGRNPSFRPRFRYFHWTTALFGAISCVIVAFLISPFAAFAAIVVIGALYWYVTSRHLAASFGDARRGLVYASARKSLLQLSSMAEDSRNWRPSILVFSGNPASRESLVTFAVWMESGCGFVFLSNILTGEFDEIKKYRDAAFRQLSEFCREKNIHAFPVVVIADTVDEGVATVLQTCAIGPIRPNLAAFGWPDDPSRATTFARHLRMARDMGMGVALLRGRRPAGWAWAKRIDLWWRGQKNGSIMVILSYLITCNWEWNRSRIRLLRVVDDEAGRDPAREALRHLLDEARIEADVEILVSGAPFPEVLRRHSRDAALILLGLNLPDEQSAPQWHEATEKMLADMPPAL